MIRFEERASRPFFVRLFYWNKEKALSVLQGDRLISASEKPTGLIHRITDSGSFVKMNIRSQTETAQFARWFGESAVKNPDGTPMVVYHGTDADFDTFDYANHGGKNGSSFGYGIYLAMKRIYVSPQISRVFALSQYISTASGRRTRLPTPFSPASTPFNRTKTMVFVRLVFQDRL